MLPTASARSGDTPRPATSNRSAQDVGARSMSDGDIWAIVDRVAHAATANVTAGVSPMALALAYFDWWVHLAVSPGRQIALAQRMIAETADNFAFAALAAFDSPADPWKYALPHDDRFRAPEWRSVPFNIYARFFLSVERWCEAATTNVRGVTRRHSEMANFAARQILDTMAPTNFVPTNAEVVARTRAEWGVNLGRGWANWMADLMRIQSGASPSGADAFRVGETVAATPGKVVGRTPLAEIIQYAPATERVRPEPIVIVPAWIMKYYILDLSPENSLVRFLTQQGFTVFIISWKNPGREDRNISFDDYRTHGVLPAIKAAIAITGARRAHAVGYCLGGTLLAVAAAAMARDGDPELATISLFAAQVDFTEAGDLMLFIDESQVAFLEDMMWERGYLDTRQMAGAFQMMRSNDLIWSRSIRQYLLGEQPFASDLMAWNADGTRMPFCMHAQYLRSMFLNNDLAEGRFIVSGSPVALSDIRLPLFAVSTERDHVAPWRSVFKLHLLTGAQVTFVLTSGGHNAGIVSEPGHPYRHFRMVTRGQDEPYIDPDRWFADHVPRDGSWWPAWTQWLAERSGTPVATPPLGDAQAGFAALDDAPGTYVFLK